MFTLKTSDNLVHLETYQDLKEELKRVRTAGSADVEWFEQNGARYMSEFIKVDGKFVEVFMFQPKGETQKCETGDDEIFSDLDQLTHGMS